MQFRQDGASRLIPTFRPYYSQTEIHAAVRALTSGWPALGPVVKQLEEEFQAVSNKKFNVAVNSCTTALHLAARCLLEPGDVVGVPAITYISSASAPAMHGCRVVFVDVDPVTLLMDPFDLVKKIRSDGITAIVPVHLYGNMATGLSEVIRKYRLKVIEDCAHVTASEYQDSIACFSFEAKKLLSCVNGGMLSTDDAEVAARARRLRFNGLDVETFGRGIARWDYDVSEHGPTGELDDLRASLVLHRLPSIRKTLKIRQENIELFDKACAAGDVVRGVPHRAGSSCYMYVVRVRSREHFLDHMMAQGIRCGVHYKPLYKHRVFAGVRAECPQAEREWLSLVTVPNLSDFSAAEKTAIQQALREYQEPDLHQNADDASLAWTRPAL